MEMIDKMVSLSKPESRLLENELSITCAKHGDIKSKFKTSRSESFFINICAYKQF